MQEVAEGVWQVCAGAYPANSYIWAGAVPGGGLLIDAGLDPEPIDAALATLGIRPAAVFCTHGHFDHIGSASFFQDRYGAEVYLHSADLKAAKAANFLMMAFRVPARLTLPRFTLLTGDTGMTRIASVAVAHRLLPGHSPGSCFIEIGPVCFSGDTLYAGGLGLSKIPGEDSGALRRSLRSIWHTTAPDTLVCPGHGAVAPFGAIRERNAALNGFVGAPAEAMPA